MNTMPKEYEVALSDLERRAACGEISLAQAKQEILALRDRFAPGGLRQVMEWAANAAVADGVAAKAQTPQA
ncbi:hypothetical protein [Azohydromonas aeria]|uniref:hypothetical protein n=1 Tax=Azohydromonas aeria TaxID=2590212 RepID=UPI0012F87408|nr:hypothetical protein [Azohydromonas aeria]